MSPVRGIGQPGLASPVWGRVSAAACSVARSQRPKESFRCTHSGSDLHGHLLVALPPPIWGSTMHSGSAIALRDVPAANHNANHAVLTKGLPVCVTGARGSPRAEEPCRWRTYCYISYLTKMACQPHLRSAFPHAYQGYACVSCVPGSPRYPHPLTRLCVWRLPPARLLVDPGVPGSTSHTLLPKARQRRYRQRNKEHEAEALRLRRQEQEQEQRRALVAKLRGFPAGCRGWRPSEGRRWQAQPAPIWPPAPVPPISPPSAVLRSSSSSPH